MSPRVILLFSGKRKSGKDYLTDHLQNEIKEKCEVIKISAPIKTHWSKEKKLNLDDLLSHSEYKEQYRLDMIKWSDDIREKDYGYFCRQACQNAEDQPIWIVSDIRRKSDVHWFNENYPDINKTIRIIADDDTRKQRGFQFKDGVDNVTSECDLDDYISWDLIINNGEGRQSLQQQIDSILALLSNII